MAHYQQDFFPADMISAELPAINRQAGLAHLEKFVPLAGSSYTKGRNFDRGRDNHSAVSRLSAHLRRRSITEEEVLGAVLKHHSFSASEKFILEIFWRGYFKGWLANRPSVWNEFVQYHHANAGKAGTDTESYRRAISGETGISCFDSWVDELKTSYYLHNHARMWFASIWIFTLGLDWQAGAAFFARYLRDFCPASNTLGWRWVAGLHTQGKHYLATAENIARCTDNRSNPVGQLDETAMPLSGAPHPPAYFSNPETPVVSSPYLLLATAEDCHLESLALACPPAAVISLPAAMGDSSWIEGVPAMRCAETLAFDKDAISESAGRASAYFDCPHYDLADSPHSAALADSLAGYAEQYRTDRIVTAYPGVGFWQTHLDSLSGQLPTGQIDVVMRAYDRLTIGAAKKGFFPFKAHIPDWLRQLLDA